MSLSLFIVTCVSVDHLGLLRGGQSDGFTANRPSSAIYLAV